MEQAATVLAQLQSSRAQKWHRRAIYALAPISLLFLCIDTLSDWHLQRTDLFIELAARLLMIALALFCAYVTKGHRDARLLMWGLLGLSLDVYWQTAYQHGGFQWMAMFVKYAAVSAGLCSLLRLTANFGDGDYHGVRAYLYDWAPASAPALGVIGLVHGALYIHGCQFIDGVCLFDVDDRGALLSYDAYLIASSVFRCAMIAAALVGVAQSSERFRSQLALIAWSCVFLALGTILDFVARIPPAGSFLRPALIYFDASTTLIFPIGLTVALFARQLFDVNIDVVLRRTLALTITTGLVLLTFTLCEVALKTAIVERLTGKLADRRWIVDVAAGVALLLAFRPLEESVLDRLDAYILPNRKKRLEIIREAGRRIMMIPDLASFAEFRLLDRIGAAVGAIFADIFLSDGKKTFKPFMWSKPPEPEPIPAAAPLVASALVAGKCAHLDCCDPTLPGADLAFPMLVGGNLYGFLVCGRKHLNGEDDAYDAQEVRELEVLARQTGMVLYALHASV